MSGVWTPAMIDRVSHLWIEGKSAREIAIEVGCGLSRNAIIGKVTRLGLQAKHRVSIPVGGAPKQAKAPRVPKPPRAPRPVRPVPVRAKAVDYRRTAIDPAHIENSREYGQSRVEWVEAGAGVESPNARPFADASPSLCRWPLADGIMCCNPKAHGAYCQGHAAVAFIPSRSSIGLQMLGALWARHDRIDLTPDLRVTTGQHRRDHAEPSQWDAGRTEQSVRRAA